MMDHDLRNVSDADYKQLIAEAYPSPKRDIHAAVMAQVTAEASQSGKKAKILTPAFRNRFVKYGSMAACLVLLVTLGFRVLPMMTKDAVLESAADFAAPEAAAAAGTAMVTADTAAYEDAETVPETAAAEENGTKTGAPALFKAVLTDSTDIPAEEVPEAEEEIEEEPISTFTYSSDIEADSSPAPEAEAPMLMMAPPPVVEEAVTEDCVVEEEIEECIVEEAVVEDCVEECIVVEEAPAEELAAPEYYRSAPDKEEGARRMFEYELKLSLSNVPAYTGWMTEHGYTDVSHWSIAEFVYDFGIAREEFTELYDALTVLFADSLYPGYAVPTYDLDKLYSMDTDITESIAAGNPGYVTDELYRQ